MNKDLDNKDQYYDNDLPKEVVELLMKTHPLKNRVEKFDEEKYATRYTKMRDQSLREELNHEENYEQVENTNKTEVKEKNVKGSSFDEYDNEDEEVVKFVKVKPKPLKSTLTYTQREIDVEEIRRLDKASELDDFFSGYEDEEYEDENDTPIDLKNPKFKKFILVGGVVGICLFVVLLVSTFTLTGKLSKAKKDIETFAELQEQNSELKLQINSLEEKIGELESEDEPKVAMNNDSEENTDGSQTDENNTAAANDTNNSTNSSTNTTNNNTTNNASTGTMDSYTVVDGDSFWTISSKVYGNGANYQKILDANGLTENDGIKPGQVLKIPR